MGVEAEMSEIDLDNAWSLRGSGDVARIESPRERLATLSAVPARSATSSLDGVEIETPRRDWAAALTLVQEAAEAIRLSEERVVELRREAEEQAQQHHADLTALHGQLVAAQREIENANMRARAAEQRASEANDWLMRLDDAINVNLGGVSRSS